MFVFFSLLLTKTTVKKSSSEPLEKANEEGQLPEANELLVQQILANPNSEMAKSLTKSKFQFHSYTY